MAIHIAIVRDSETDKVKVTLRDVLDALGLTVNKLAELANLHPDTVRRALVPGSEYGTNVTSALAIAQAVGLKVEEIDWANGLSVMGRPAETGVALTRALPDTKLCPIHHIALPLSGICDEC